MQLTMIAAALAAVIVAQSAMGDQGRTPASKNTSSPINSATQTPSAKTSGADPTMRPGGKNDVSSQAASSNSTGRKAMTKHKKMAAASH